MIDSNNLSGGTGLLVMKIVKFIKEKINAIDIVNRIKELVPKVRTQFVVDTLKYLHMGGRCKATAKYIATALHIKPIIAVKEGKMEITKKPIGYKKGLDIMLDQVRELKDNIDLDHILVTHPDAESDAEYLKSKIVAEWPDVEVSIFNVGPVIGSHSGPGTLALFFIGTER